jgi:hypothetical protein
LTYGARPAKAAICLRFALHNSGITASIKVVFSPTDFTDLITFAFSFSFFDYYGTILQNGIFM